MHIIKWNLIIGILIIHLSFFIGLINCYSMELNVDSNSSLEDNDFLDIIIDNNHAYAYLSYMDHGEGTRQSIYSSLKPKEDAGRKNLEGIDRFPVILERLLREEKSQDIARQAMAETLTLKEFTSAFFFSIYYLFSNFFETADQGKVVRDVPIRDQIKIQRRFYLDAQQLKKAKAVIHKSFIDSSNGNILYDVLHYNCVDYVKEIYDFIGLDKTRGEFLSQFDATLVHSNMKNHFPFTILKIYEFHNEGAIGPMKVVKGIWKGIRMISLRNSEK